MHSIASALVVRARVTAITAGPARWLAAQRKCQLDQFKHSLAKPWSVAWWLDLETEAHQPTSFS